MYKIILTFRYLLKRRISYFAVLAVALCVFVVFIVITVLSGLTAEFKTNTHRSLGDCVVNSKSLVGFGYYQEFIDKLELTDFVEAASPVIKSYAFVEITLGPYHSKTLEILGIDATAHSRVTAFGQWLGFNKADARNAFKPSYDPNLPGCVWGVGVLFDRNSEGNYVVPAEVPKYIADVSCFPLTAKGALAKAGMGIVNTKTFYYSDHAESKIRADWTVLYLPFDEAQMLCGMGTEPKRANAIHIKFKPGVRLNKGCARVKRLWEDFVEDKAGLSGANLLENVRVQNWKMYNRHIIAAVETERIMMMIVFGMIGIITVFVVFVVFYMIVSHKSKDIGILKSLGASNANVLSLFLGFASLIGVLGALIGAVGGWQFLVHINQIEDWLFRQFGFQLWGRTIYAIGDIPNKIEFGVLAPIVLSAIVACMIGALIPSRQAAKLKPVETLQVTQL
ncbi:MAG: ABC transporter permease [Planctomycetota bacterium]|jgi:ABC-type lipoprotein release transport system permease subunit